jgi:subtilisin family serine protease
MSTLALRTTLALLMLAAMVAGGLFPARAQGPDGTHTTPTQGVFPEDDARSNPPGEFESGEVLVKLKEDVPTLSAMRMPSQYNATRVRVLLVRNVQLWQVPKGQELTTVKELSADPRVEYAEPNFLYHASGLPNDPRLSTQWAHALLRSPSAWDITTGSASLAVAIIDTGIDLGHPDLAAKLVPGYDFVDGGNPWDDNGHGTHVAGIAAAATNNGIGVAGMDWQARIMPVRVLNKEGVGSLDDIADGIYWAYRNGAEVLNLSLTSPSDAQTMRRAVSDAHAAGALVVASMGNCRIYTPPECPTVNPTSYPAAYATVMAVAATTRQDGYAYYSQYGNYCDISAPGGDISLLEQDGVISTLPTYDGFYMKTVLGYAKNYDYGQGTSLAAPYVAGLASLIWAVDPTLTPDQVRQVIQGTADDLGAEGWDPDFGHGRINAQAALQAISTPAAPTLFPIDNEDDSDTYLIDWNDVPNATAYVLEEDSHLGFPSPIERYRGERSWFQVEEQATGVWYYRVRARNRVGYSPWSDIQLAKVPPNPPVLDPIANAGNDDEYKVSWQPSVGATGYTLEEADSPSFEYPRTRYVGSALQYHVTGQLEGTWYYRARAHNAAGDGLWSEPAQSTSVDPAALQPPDLGVIQNSDGDGDYVVTWTRVPEANNYTLEESGNPYFDNPTEVYSGSASRFTVKDQRGGIWYYRVRAFGSPGKSPWSQQRSTTVTSWVYLPFVPHNHGSDSTKQ